MIRDIIATLLAGQDIEAAGASTLMAAIMDGHLDDARLGAVLAALKLKGVTAAELGGFARTMRARAITVEAESIGRAVDTCGTGGDGKDTFNISTAAALITAATGVPVAKHGNRSASSRCGSADVLEALGVHLDLPAEVQGTLLDSVGIAFLFAPNHHPAMRHAATVRRSLGVRTVFNLLGPLANPAGVRRQLLGVYAPRLTDLMAAALRELDAERALVVHGRDGQDEFSLTGETLVVELDQGQLSRRIVIPAEAGLQPCKPEDLAGGEVVDNARLMMAVLNGEPGPRTDAALLNAAGALLAAGVATDLHDGVEQAREAVGDGRASRLLQTLRTASHDLATSAEQASGGGS